jgi:hypothetical protein
MRLFTGEKAEPGGLLMDIEHKLLIKEGHRLIAESKAIVVCAKTVMEESTGVIRRAEETCFKKIRFKRGDFEGH